MKRWIIVAGLILLPVLSVADGSEGEPPETQKRHKLTVSVGYVYVPKGAKEEGGDEGIFVPAAGIDYFYRLSEKWEVGLMMDIEFKEYVIPAEDLHRENSIAFAAVLGFGLVGDLAVLFGGGIELEESENLPFLRLGTEYEFRPGGSWVIAPGLVFDIKKDYTSMEIVLGAGMEF